MSEFTGYKYEDLDIGMSHETVHVITEDDIQRFAEVSGDFNPLHMSDDFAAKTIFGKRIAHGALTASYISGILGNNLPGPGAIFIGLSMRFKRPVHIGDEVIVRAEVSEAETTACLRPRKTRRPRSVPSDRSACSNACPRTSIDSEVPRIATASAASAPAFRATEIRAWPSSSSVSVI